MPVRRHRARFSAIAVAAACVLPLVVTATAAGERPADSLARDGAMPGQFFIQPVCSPTRAKLLTDR
jgi:hypothetical protein